MKTWQKPVLGIAIVPIIWGIVVDLRYGQIASFITRVIVVTLIGLLLSFVYDKIENKVKTKNSINKH